MMKRFSMILCAAAVGVVASSPAQASFHVIRWTSGFCQVWNNAVPGKPIPGDYKVVSPKFKTLGDALNAKAKMLGKTCIW
jgi:hypothetical protein